MKKSFAAFGSHCIDYYTNLNGGTAFAGGGPLNSAVHIRSLGIDAIYVGAVGSDGYGKMILRELERHGVDISHIKVVEGNSAVCRVTLEDGERILGDYDEGVLAGFVLDDEDLHVIADAGVCLCDFWGRQEDSFAKLKESGANIAFDCADRPDDPITQKVIPYVTYLFFSAKEDIPSLREKMQLLKDKGPLSVTATLGSSGSITLDETGFTFCEAEKADTVIDSMGAGDSYIAGFLYGVLNGYSAYECMKQGSQLAIKTLAYHGAFPQEADQ